MATLYTTPTVKVTVKGVDVSGSTAMLTLWQYENRMRTKSRKLDIEGDQLAMSLVGDDTVLVCVLTQEQSGMFEPRKEVLVKANFIDSKGTRVATEESTLRFSENPVDRVLENGTGTIDPTVEHEVEAEVAELIASVTVGTVTTKDIADGAVTKDKLGVDVSLDVTDGDLVISLG